MLLVHLQEYPDVCFRMLEYDKWSRPVAVRTVKNEAILLEQQVFKPLTNAAEHKVRAITR